MKIVRKIILFGFTGIILTILISFLLLFLLPPNEQQLAKAFPDDSYNLYLDGKIVTLYSLKPEGWIEGREDFHGFNVLGKTEVKSSVSQFLLKRSLINLTTFPEGAACFNPRHGLRISDGVNTIDLVICFECGNIVSIYGDRDGRNGTGILLSETIYNKILKDAGIETSETALLSTDDR